MGWKIAAGSILDVSFDLFGEDFGIRINDFRAQRCGDAVDGLVNLLELAGEIAGGRGDSCDAEGGTVPDNAVIKLGDGEVEAIAELVFERTEDLATVFERLSVGDLQFDS